MNNVKYEKLNAKDWYASFKLPDHVVSYLWDQIKVAEKENTDHRHELAGNISRSLTLKDPHNVMIDNIFQSLFDSDLKTFFIDNVERSFRSVFPRRISFGKPAEPKLESFWVNFQKKYEFNPLHDHSGIFSFVVWMKIPYNHEDEKELPWVKGSSINTAVGNFVFVDRDFRHHVMHVDTETEGHMCIFPSHLHHMVYPFYTSDEERISISGNIFFELEQ